jgi:hypothetical protein
VIQASDDWSAGRAPPTRAGKSWPLTEDQEVVRPGIVKPMTDRAGQPASSWPEAAQRRRVSGRSGRAVGAGSAGAARQLAEHGAYGSRGGPADPAVKRYGALMVMTRLCVADSPEAPRKTSCHFQVPAARILKETVPDELVRCG